MDMFLEERRRRFSTLETVIGITFLLGGMVILVNGAGHYNRLSKIESQQNLFSACYEANRDYEGENLFDKLVGINVRNIYYRNNCKTKNHLQHRVFF